MTLELPMNRIIDRIADASRRRRNSGFVWLFLGAVFQAGIVLLLLKAQSFADASVWNKLGFFFFASFFAAWLPMAVGVYYWRRSRKSAMRPENLLQRSLTSEPRLIAEIQHEPIVVHQAVAAPKPAEKAVDERGGEIAGAILGSVVEVALSAAFGGTSDSSSNNDYDASGTNSTASAPRVFVRLTNGEKHEISTSLDAAATVAALKKHAAHAAIVEVAR